MKPWERGPFKEDRMKNHATIDDCEKIVLRLGILPGWKMRINVVPEDGHFEVSYSKGKYKGSLVLKREWVEDRNLGEIDPLLKQLQGAAERGYHKVSVGDYNNVQVGELDD